MTKKKDETRKVARSAETGQFIPMSEAKKYPDETVIETVKKAKKQEI